MEQTRQSTVQLSQQRHILHALAEETAVPFERVERIYAEELEELRRRSRIVTFVPLLAARHVRDRLRRERNPRSKVLHAP